MFGGGNNFGRGEGSDFRRDSNSDLNSMSMGSSGNAGGSGGKYAISELYDENEKDAVFRSSKKKGGAMHQFNETLKASPDYF